MVGVRALSLILSAFALVQGAVRSDWFERARTVRVVDLEALVREMEAEIEADASVLHSDDLRRGYVMASVLLLEANTSELPDGSLALDARLEIARGAARRFGVDDDRLRVENLYAEKLLLAGRPAEARKVLEDGRTLFPAAVDALARNLEDATDAEVQACDYVQAEGFAARCEELLADLIPKARGPEFRIALLESQIRVLGHQARIATVLGLPERAYEAVDRQRSYLAQALALDPNTFERMRALRSQCDLDLLQHAFRSVLERIAQAEPSIEDPDDRVMLGLLRGVALRGLVRESEEPPRGAEEILRHVRDLADSPQVQDDADFFLADLLISLGRLSEADELVSASIARRATANGSYDECWPEYAAIRAIALRARIRLLRKSGLEELEATRRELLALEDRALEATRRLPPRPEGIGLLHWQSRRLPISMLIELELATKDDGTGEEAALGHVLRAQDVGSLARMLALPPTDIASLRSLLHGDHEGLIVFLPGSDESHLFTIDRQATRHHFLPARHVLVAAVQEFAACMQGPRSAGPDDEQAKRDLEAAGLVLRDLLFPSSATADMDRWDGFYVSGFDLLASPELDSLPWLRGRPLGEEKAIGRLPSLPVGAWLTRRAAGRSGEGPGDRLVVVAAPDQSPRIARDWPEATAFELGERQRAELSESFDETTFLTASDATLDNLVAELDRGRAGVLAFVTHGVHDFGRSRPAGLVLAPSRDDPDGVLWCERIEQRLTTPPIVALFACGTAFGPTRLGDDTATALGNSLLVRGSDVVLLSRTRVEYGPMIALARAFLRHLAGGGLSPAESLRRARVELGRSARWSDIRHHGQVALHGLGLEPRPARAADRKQEQTPTRRRANSAAVMFSFAAVLGSIALIARARSKRRASRSPSS